MNPYQVYWNQGATPIFHGISGNFVQILANSKNIFFYKIIWQKSFIFGLGSAQGT